MNIFVLSEDPVKAAQYQHDLHVRKMLLETAQLLCNAIPEVAAPYKRTHYHHPCSVWTRESKDNFTWLYKHGLALCEEYHLRFNKPHKTIQVILDLHEFSVGFQMDHTPFCLAMPDQYKMDNVVDSYRAYYRGEKLSGGTTRPWKAKWTNRSQPSWINHEF